MLKWIYALVQNYGLAIILLTFLINLALVPIRYKQIVSMKKMTEVQPQLKAIQNRYKDLPPQRSQEAGNEQRGHGALQAARGQPAGKLPAASSPNAVFVCFLHNATDLN